jgi:hypothetical protein
MGHAKVGDTIRILDDNHGNWVKVDQEYYVESVDEGNEDEKVYKLRNVYECWCGAPEHFKIVNKSPAKVHPKYDTFHKGNTVRRWRDVEDWEWECIGAVGLPAIGEDVEVKDVDINNRHKEDSFYSVEHGYWYPMKAFVLAEYYNQSITNQGTVDSLNTNSYGKDHSSKVQGPASTIITREGSTGSRIQGRRNVSIVRRGHLSYQTITGK